MTILALRTDNPEAEVYLLEDDKVVDSIKWQAHRELSDTIHIKIKEILNKSSKQLGDLEGLVVFKGPGSFTGLRIGAVVGNTMAYALNIPVVGSLSDDWLAEGAKKLLAGSNDKIVTPEYGKPANITAPRK